MLKIGNSSAMKFENVTENKCIKIYGCKISDAVLQCLIFYMKEWYS